MKEEQVEQLLTEMKVNYLELSTMPTYSLLELKGYRDCIWDICLLLNKEQLFKEITEIK